MQQGSKEWIEVRKRHIGSSDASVCMGLSPWKTKHQLWKEKIGISSFEFENYAMKRGKDLEPIARNAFIKKMGETVEPEIRYHRKIPYMMASLDGINSSGTMVVEIKCPGKIDHDYAAQGKIPEKYVPQLQHIMEVCEVSSMYYFSFNGKNDILLQIFKDEQYIEKLLREEKEFWWHVENIQEPENQETHIKIISPQWQSASDEYIEASQNLKNWELKKQESREKLISLSKGINCYGNGIKLTKSQRKGHVQYKEIEELKNVDIEKYRKPDIETWNIDIEEQL